MKPTISLVTLFTAATVCSSTLFAQEKPASPKVTVENNHVKVVYGQPSKKGREIFGALVPYGQVWRTGANEATEITFAKDSKIDGKDIKAGTYTLFTIPDKDNWTLILNSELKQWGSYGYDKIKDKDVVKISTPVVKEATVTEKLTFSLKEQDKTTNLIIQWDTTKIIVPITY